jgi:catechol 2,3-dioxygenase-like lactoylglutathione lyase family enzyme
MRTGRAALIDIAQEDFQMKRFHVHVGVENLEQSIRFYSGLFGAGPTVRKPDYAMWMIDEPRVNFAISQRGAANVGVNHLGLQAESDDELAGLLDRFEAAGASSVVDEPNAHCCYATGNKHWVMDPQGIAWEAFHTLDSIPFYGGVAGEAETDDRCCSPSATSGGCCAPAADSTTQAGQQRGKRAACCR